MSSSTTSGFFGWDLLYNSVERDIKSNQDVLVCFTHLVLISNGFKCIGLGDSKNIDGTETKSEVLPKGWNENYAIRYVYQGRLYNLRGTNLEDAVMINLVRVEERTVSMVQLNVRAVTQRSGMLEQIIPDNVAVAATIKKQLIDKIVVSSKLKDGSSQTPPSAPDIPRGESSNLRSPSTPLLESRSIVGPGQIFDPLNVGRQDLDPFPTLNPFGRQPLPLAPGGGGMLFPSPQGPRFDPGPNIGIAPGSIPPGARFDPFRPPTVDRMPPRRPNPDSDELPPPGYDDMYM